MNEQTIEQMAKDAWNKQADHCNQWPSLGQDEKDELIQEVKDGLNLGALKPGAKESNE